MQNISAYVIFHENLHGCMCEWHWSIIEKSSHPVLNETNDEIFLLPFHRLNTKKARIVLLLLKKNI